MHKLHAADVVVVLGYVAGLLGIAIWFVRRSRTSQAFMAADRALPGWAVGLSIFGSYISSISFLANPGSSYGGNWNAFVFNLTTPIAALIAVWWFVPFYRKHGNVSAYEHLESRFGPWARTYAVVCFLLMQMARMGTIIFLLSSVLVELTDWPAVGVIALIGVVMTAVALLGGIKAVVWAGVAQSAVLVAGLVICIIYIVSTLPRGVSDALHQASDAGLFGLGEFGPSLAMPTFWVVLMYGLVTNLQNFGIDQSYVQRYITARTDRDARRSVWIGAWLFVPTGAGFFLIGTLLWVCTSSGTLTLPPDTKADSVFPYFIATHIPAGLKGLVIAALLAAAMDSNLNNMATLSLCDLYRRYVRPMARPHESLWVLRLATLVWGVAGTGMGLAMTRVKGVLDAWWNLAGIFSGGMLGLFLLGLISKRAHNASAAIGVGAGVLVILWMTFSPDLPDSWSAWRSPFHKYLILVFGTLAIFLVGTAVGRLRRAGAST